MRKEAVASAGALVAMCGVYHIPIRQDPMVIHLDAGVQVI